MGAYGAAGPAYYNEIDPFAAQWLRNLIAAGHIAPGEVDERSITEISADDLRGFTQCHFFAGVGVWSHALRRAGWGDDQPVWTGSSPCQPFSAAGKQAGFADERHLWPVWFKLIAECRPPIVLGEQVASALDWLDLVSADMEGAGYAFGASDLCAAGFGGAHIRQRLYFVGLADADGGEPRQTGGLQSGGQHRQQQQQEDDGAVERVAHHHHQGQQGRGRVPERPNQRAARASGVAGGLAELRGEGRQQVGSDAGGSGSGSGSGAQGLDERSGDGSAMCGLGNSELREPWRDARAGDRTEAPVDVTGIAEHGPVGDRHSVASADDRTRAPLLGRHPVDWLYCRDGKWRPVEPGTFPLADAAPARVGRLRAYGNGLDAETATQFVGAVAESVWPAWGLA